MIPGDAEVLGFGTLSTPMKKKYKACSCVSEELRQAKRARVIDEINRFKTQKQAADWHYNWVKKRFESNGFKEKTIIFKKQKHF